MAEYNYSDINEAKRRVQEMKGRVKDKTNEERKSDIASMLSRISSNKDKALFILLLYVLSCEECDEELLLSALAILL